jgi:putative flippase GtrA
MSEAVGFALAGGAAYVVDLGVFVWLRGAGGMGPLSAKTLSFVAGCTVAYAGNALGTYRRREPVGGRTRRLGVFLAVNFAGALVQLACLAFSHYVLGFTAPRDDIVSGAGVGMVLATALRFWGTRNLVFGTGGQSGRAGARHPGGRTAGHPEAGAVDAGSVQGAVEGNRPTWTG